jgi:hypothetical protein
MVSKDPRVIFVTQYFIHVYNSHAIVVHTDALLVVYPLASKDGNIKIDTIV